MIPIFLQDALVDELKVLFKGFKLYNSKNQLSEISVFPQNLPFRRKEDEITPFPHILVCLEEGEITDFDTYNVKIHIIIGIHDSRPDAQGERDIINMITRIYEHLFNKKIIAKKYEIMHPFVWVLQDEDTHPKYKGGIETNWKLRTISQQEVEFL